MKRKSDAMEIDQAPMEMSNDSDLSAPSKNENVHQAASRPVSPYAPSMSNPSAARDQELRAFLEDSAFHILAQKMMVRKPRVDPRQAQEGLLDGNISSLSFPKKMWHIVENAMFKSIGWDQSGLYIRIDEELFKSEVLGRQELPQIFGTTSIKSFIRQLNLYGFKNARPLRSASLSIFVTEERSASKLFYSTCFRRGCPDLLAQMKRRVRIKSRGKKVPGISAGSQERLGSNGKSQSAQTGPSSGVPSSSTFAFALDKSTCSQALVSPDRRQLPAVKNTGDKRCDGPAGPSRAASSSSSELQVALGSNLGAALPRLLSFLPLLASSDGTQSPAQLQAQVATWMSICSIPWMSPSVLAAMTSLLSVSSSLQPAQPCANCGYSPTGLDKQD